MTFAAILAALTLFSVALVCVARTQSPSGSRGAAQRADHRDPKGCNC